MTDNGRPNDGHYLFFLNNNSKNEAFVLQIFCLQTKPNKKAYDSCQTDNFNKISEKSKNSKYQIIINMITTCYKYTPLAYFSVFPSHLGVNT